MKRQILIATAVIFSTLTLWAQTGAARATGGHIVLTEAHSQHQKNKQRSHRHHQHHHTSINARR